MARQTRLIQCALRARHLNPRPRRRISIMASGQERTVQTEAGHMNAGDRRIRKSALAIEGVRI